MLLASEEDHYFMSESFHEGLAYTVGSKMRLRMFLDLEQVAINSETKLQHLTFHHNEPVAAPMSLFLLPEVFQSHIQGSHGRASVP